MVGYGIERGDGYKHLATGNTPLCDLRFESARHLDFLNSGSFAFELLEIHEEMYILIVDVRILNKILAWNLLSKSQLSLSRHTII